MFFVVDIPDAALKETRPCFASDLDVLGEIDYTARGTAFVIAPSWMASTVETRS